MKLRFCLLSAAVAALCACSGVCGGSLTDVILDSDANNELDDQHAIAYMLLNQENTFNVIGITTNATWGGGDAMEQCKEARRVVDLMGDYGKGITLVPGATGNFEDIRANIGNETFDGSGAVDFIIENARKHSPEKKLTLIPVGKLTNVALALEKAPDIAANLRIVWLGSNYPESGEYNLENDIPSMNYVLDTDADFEIVTVGSSSGTSAVRVSLERVRKDFAGKGPQVEPVEGRNGGSFTCFGDYSVDLFEHINRGSDDSRALYDMAAVATVKNPQWAEAERIPAPTMVEGKWVERPENPRMITLWRNFDKEGIISDFISSLEESNN